VADLDGGFSLMVVRPGDRVAFIGKNIAKGHIGCSRRR
jgi:hypothetical protein